MNMQMDGEDTHRHTRNEEKSLEQKVEECVLNDFDDTREWMRN